MKSQKKLWFVLWIMICFLLQAKAQTIKNNEAIVSGMYNALENKDEPSLIANWVPDMKWYQSTDQFNEADPYISDNKVLKDIYRLLEDEWQNVVFKNMNIQEIEKDVVLVTGTLTGRKSKETAIVSSEFHHLWWLKDGKVVKFLE